MVNEFSSMRPANFPGAISAVLLIISLFIFPGSGFSQENHRKIEEKVEVNWWQVPVFAVDRSGNPIIDLEAADIEVWVNNRRVEEFVFYKRVFSVIETTEETVQPRPRSREEQEPRAPVMKNNSIFLLFDLTLSAETCARRGKEVAKKIITSAAPESKFVILTIEPFIGLHYVCGPSSDKKKLLENLDRKVIHKHNQRTVNGAAFFRLLSQPAPGKSKSKISTDDTETGALTSQAGAYYMRKSLGFFEAFESLYILLNSIRNNKFVYFFTEGISSSLRGSIMGGSAMYNSFLRKGAKYLGQSGVVLFIVNPMGVGDDTSLTTVREKKETPGAQTESHFTTGENQSGEDSLRYLSKQSGGKYLEGEYEKIVNTLENMHRAYYEVSFPDIPGLQGDTRSITIKPKRKGVTVHTLRSLEKTKRYAEMSGLEKELLILNLISGNPMLKQQMAVEHARVTKMKQDDTRVVYRVKLPNDCVRRKLDLYKFWIKEADTDNRQVIRVEKETLVPSKRKIMIRCPLTEKETRGTMPYFALVDPAAEKALVRIIGDRWTDDDEEEEKTRLADKIKAGKAGTIDKETMNRLLEGAAVYCEKLKKSAFHFMCREAIVETRQPLAANPRRRFSRRSAAPSITTAVYDEYAANLGLLSPDSREKTRVNKYLFTYRLIKSESDIKEERQRLKEKKGTPLDVSKEQVIEHTVFFSERAIFAPATLLAAERQDRYIFKFEGFARRKGRRCAVISGTPRSPGIEKGFYGKVWIDLEDHSIVKVLADPKSINGFVRLKELSRKLQARLQLSLEIDFDEKREGICFPTRVSMLEKYKGGRIISMYKGREGWQRTHTVFNYSNYQFFSVQVEVTIDPR